MKKITITVFAALLMMTGVKAQSIPEGMGHLYAKRYKSATDVFQKLIAANPNNIEAIYWLGQTYFNMDDNAAARQLYEKALTTNGGAPLILVGVGHADLLDSKANDARMRFESAITASRGRKGDDPVIQTAIGRAIVDSKIGDFRWAVQLLQSATEKDPKNTETLLQLGNAHRKADPGNGGGEAYKAYNKALEVNPNFSVASMRLAKLFESQKNWEFVLKYLNESITRDTKFSDGYYELFWYYFLRRNYTEASTQLTKYKESKLPESDIQDEFLNGQLCYVSKDYDCAIAKGLSVLSALGDKAKPRIYNMLAFAYYDKGDYVNAAKYSDIFFSKEKPDEVTAIQKKLRADILGKMPDTDSLKLFNAYMEAVDADTVLTSKVDLLKEIAGIFKSRKQRIPEAWVLEKIILIKPKPTINDYFDLTVAYYFGKDYPRSREKALVMRDEKYTDQIYGYEWAFNNSQIMDTVRKDSIAVPDAIKLHDFVFQDTVKYKKQYISAARFLGGYYVNDAKDYEKALIYFQKWHDSDTANAVKIEEYMDQIRRMLQKQGTKPAGTTPAKPTGNKTSAVKPAATKTTKAVAAKPKSTTSKTVVKK